MGDFRPAGEFMEDPQAPCGSACPHVSLLVQVTDDGRVADNFRVALSATRIHTARFKGADIFIHKQFHPFSFTYEMAPAEIEFPVGKTAGGWDSLADMVLSGKILAVRIGQGPDFLEVWEKHSGDASRPAAAVRWAVVLDDEAGTNLALQGLPADAKRVKGIPVLKRDDAPTILLHTTRLTHARDRKVGPESIKPILYAGDEKQAAAAVEERPGVFYTGLRRVWHHFFNPETVDLEDAAKLIRNPREGHCYRPLAGTAAAEDDLAAGGDAPGPGDQSGKLFSPTPVERKYSKYRVDNLSWFTPEKENLTKKEKILRANLYGRVSEGLAEKTWDRHRTVWRAINEFSAYVGRPLTWPLGQKTIADFASWCDKSRHLQASTIKVYVQGLSKIQQMRGGPAISVNKIPLLKNFLSGVENVPRNAERRQKKAMSYPFLQVMGNTLRKDEEMSSFEKLRFWSVCLWGFFGSFRMGELLSEHKKTYDPFTHLLWKDAKFTENDDICIQVKSPKTKTPGGDLVVMFKFPVKSMCPVTVFQEYSEETRRKGLWDENLPIFRNEDGTNWAKFEFGKVLERLTRMTGILEEGEKIVSHSFRAGIPSHLAALGTPEADGAAKEWGRWRSEAFKTYTKHHVAAKKEIFKTVCSLLLK